MNPEISIIVPVYKVEPYLRKCIDSILAQTFTNFELILVDDGSPDSCGKICDEYVEKDKRIIVIHKENGGQSSARNRALDIAKGNYIGFVDSDDWIEPDMYETLYNLILKSGKDIANIGFNFIIGESIKTFSSHGEISLNKEEALEELINHKLYGNYFCTNLFKKSLIQNFRFKEGIIFEDVDLIYKIIDASNGVISIGKSKYNYLKREGSTVKTYKNNKNIDLQIAKYERYKFLKNKYPKIKKKLYNKNEFWENYDTLIDFLNDETLEGKLKKEKLIEIINSYFYQNMKLSIPLGVKIRLLILKISYNLFEKIFKK